MVTEVQSPSSSNNWEIDSSISIKPLRSEESNAGHGQPPLPMASRPARSFKSHRVTPLKAAPQTSPGKEATALATLAGKMLKVLPFCGKALAAFSS